MSDGHTTQWGIAFSLFSRSFISADRGHLVCGAIYFQRIRPKDTHCVAEFGKRDGFLHLIRYSITCSSTNNLSFFLGFSKLHFTGLAIQNKIASGTKVRHVLRTYAMQSLVFIVLKFAEVSVHAAAPVTPGMVNWS